MYVVTQDAVEVRYFHTQEEATKWAMNAYYANEFSSFSSWKIDGHEWFLLWCSDRDAL